MWLIGGGELEEKIRGQIEGLKIAEHVRLMGITDHVQDYLQAMDVFVFPSHYEGLPIALVEAQAAGLPCVVSENIVKEADMGAGLIQRFRLTDDLQKWIDAIQKARSISRFDTTGFISKAGFDIKDTSMYLENFYSANWPN